MGSSVQPTARHTENNAAPVSGEKVGVVVIGRNEGARLVACLNSLEGASADIVYVDSGSTDESVKNARAVGANVVALDMSTPFTAARARNAGYRALKQSNAPEFVQFIDGDCEMAPGWLETGVEFLKDSPDAAVAFGDVREKFPEKTFFNRMIDREWRGAPGQADFCGGIAMMRAADFEKAGGFRDDLIAGEEPELCVRLRESGRRIYRLEASMAAHDADMKNLGEWLKRARRAGHAFAEVSAIHAGSDKRIWARETLRAVFWTGLAVSIIAVGLVLHPVFFLGLLIYPLQIIRMGLRNKSGDGVAHATLIMMQKPWEAAGVLQYWLNRWRGRRARIIEYRNKGDAGRTS